jgi:hypothetical protein
MLQLRQSDCGLHLPASQAKFVEKFLASFAWRANLSRRSSRSLSVSGGHS